MFFCPKCSYSLDIKKSSGITTKSEKDTDEEKVFTGKKITSVASAIKEVIENEINPISLNVSFTMESMKKNPKYKSLNTHEKSKMLQLFDQTGGSINAEFKCTNCAYSQQINQTTKLYQINVNDSSKKMTDTDYFLIVNNPILARTKDYTCKNSLCPTHKDSSIKEAVFYHHNKSLTVNYVCTVCRFAYN